MRGGRGEVLYARGDGGSSRLETLREAGRDFLDGGERGVDEDLCGKATYDQLTSLAREGESSEGATLNAPLQSRS